MSFFYHGADNDSRIQSKIDRQAALSHAYFDRRKVQMMINMIKERYKTIYLTYVKAFLIGWAVFLSAIVLTMAICSILHVNPQSFFKELAGRFPDYRSDDRAFAGIFSNNVNACLRMFVLSLIPILFLPWLSVVSNGALIGFVLYVVVYLRLNFVKIVLLGLLPHGIIECAAIILTACMATNLQKLWIKKIKNMFRRKKNRQPTDSLTHCLIKTAEQFLLVVLPLVLVAAMIEAYISGYLLNRFM
jgi:stage II sporulation protein M